MLGGNTVTDKNKEMMLRMLEEKKQKSASQGLDKRAPANVGGARKGIKRHRKGGLFDK